MKVSGTLARDVSLHPATREILERTNVRLFDRMVSLLQTNPELAPNFGLPSSFASAYPIWSPAWVQSLSPLMKLPTLMWSPGFELTDYGSIRTVVPPVRNGLPRSELEEFNYIYLDALREISRYDVAPSWRTNTAANLAPRLGMLGQHHITRAVRSHLSPLFRFRLNKPHLLNQLRPGSFIKSINRIHMLMATSANRVQDLDSQHWELPRDDLDSQMFAHWLLSEGARGGVVADFLKLRPREASRLFMRYNSASCVGGRMANSVGMLLRYIDTREQSTCLLLLFRLAMADTQNPHISAMLAWQRLGEICNVENLAVDLGRLMLLISRPASGDHYTFVDCARCNTPYLAMPDKDRRNGKYICACCGTAKLATVTRPAKR